MAWDSSRKVPWQRLIREWLLYVGIAAAAYIIYYTTKHRPLQIGLFAGLFASGPMYLLFGSVLAKFGYQRKTMKELRTQRPLASAARASRSNSAASTSPTRTRPAPTGRTSTGPSQHRKNNKPKRR